LEDLRRFRAGIDWHRPAAALLVNLLGWHWEFLPSFLAKLVPGVDLVPFWTMAVANVYRKSKRIAVTAEESREQHAALKDPQGS
jgi:hypothetical protein